MENLFQNEEKITIDANWPDDNKSNFKNEKMPYFYNTKFVWMQMVFLVNERIRNESKNKKLCAQKIMSTLQQVLLQIYYIILCTRIHINHMRMGLFLPYDFKRYGRACIYEYTYILYNLDRNEKYFRIEICWILVSSKTLYCDFWLLEHGQFNWHK